jgi:hypothetical protein
MRDKESMGAVNEGTLQCESIQRLNGRGEGGCVKGKEMIKVCYGCWLMGGRGGLRLVYYFILFFIFKPSWPVQAHQNRKPNRTEHFSKYFNRFNRFFLPVRFFRLIFFGFLG